MRRRRWHELRGRGMRRGRRGGRAGRVAAAPAAAANHLATDAFAAASQPVAAADAAAADATHLAADAVTAASHSVTAADAAAAVAAAAGAAAVSAANDRRLRGRRLDERPRRSVAHLPHDPVPSRRPAPPGVDGTAIRGRVGFNR